MDEGPPNIVLSTVQNHHKGEKYMFKNDKISIVPIK